MLQFNPKTGLSVPTAEEVREEVRGQWQAAFTGNNMPALDVSEETPAGQLIDAETALIVENNNVLLELANAFNPAVASGVWQDALAKIYFLTRQTAQPTVVACTCSGLSGTLIPAGTLAQDALGHTFIATGAAVIPENGSVEVNFRLSEPGPIYIAPETVNKIITVVPGWDTVTNPAAGITGRDAETRAEFEARRVQSVAANGHGTLGAIYAAVAGLPGVLDCVALENITNAPVEKYGVTIEPHSVFISVSGGEDADIAEAIYRKKDAGCGTTGNHAVTYTDPNYYGASYTYNITRPAPTELGVRVTLRRTASTPQNIEQLITAAVMNNFNGVGGNSPRVGMAQTLYASRFYCPVISAGAQELISVELSYPLSGGVWGDSAEIPADQIPTLAEEDVIINIQGS